AVLKRIERIDRVLLQLVLQRARRELEQPRGTRAVATCAHERQADQPLLERAAPALDGQILTVRLTRDARVTRVIGVVRVRLRRVDGRLQEREELAADARAAAQDQRALERVLELAHVAGPRMRGQRL